MYRMQRGQWNTYGLLAATLLVAPSAGAIDCGKAGTSTEKVICADDQLQGLDWQLNRDYRVFVTYHRATGHYDCLVEDEADRQKQWLQQRDACGGDVQCIQKAYQNRLAALNKYTMICVGGDNMPQYAGRSCYKPDTTSTAPVTSGSSPTAPTVPASSAGKCPEGERIDFNFVSTWEGGQALSAYVPGGYVRDKKKSGPVYVYLKPAKHRNISASSGVTVDTGVDLAYQLPAKLKNTLQSYISKHGNPGNVKVDGLVNKLSIYMSNKIVGQKAFDKLVGKEPEVSEAEADLLRDANAKQVYIPKAESNFNQHNQMGIGFKQLPAGIQTVLVDWTWQFGGADEIHLHSHGNQKAVASRQAFWSLVYAGDWNQLANKLERADFARRGNGYDERYRARGKQIREAIKNDWPSKGAAC
ncbi:pesticin C-terminus-like muramidase [Acidithiobacillus sp. M4-SHS-6]|uniref:pesticin C-terminus-like muramidase n=1 Tax=Acidithiobacillus sp. M4-SHS-6 TaxID=3383024 RepID=UPI0039BEA01D